MLAYGCAVMPEETLDLLVLTDLHYTHHVSKGSPVPERKGSLSKELAVRAIREAHRQFQPDALVLLGDLVDDGSLPGAKQDLQELYDLDDDIAERLVIKFHIPGKKEGTKTVKYIQEDDHIVQQDGIPVAGDLAVMYGAGTSRNVDVSCDSDFMRNAMKEIGKKIRQAYHWVELGWPIFLYMDNAGGHGTHDCVKSYVAMLEREFNIIVIHIYTRAFLLSEDSSHYDKSLLLSMRGEVPHYYEIT